MTVCRRKETEEPGGCGIRHRRDIATGRVGKKKTLRGGIRRVLVELMVIETTTSSMRTKRSTTQDNIGHYSATPAQMQVPWRRFLDSDPS